MNIPPMIAIFMEIMEIIYRCILNTVTNQCKKYKWVELPSTDLGKFKYDVIYNENYIGKACSPEGNKCAVKTCSDFKTKQDCENVQFTLA